MDAVGVCPDSRLNVIVDKCGDVMPLCHGDTGCRESRKVVRGCGYDQRGDVASRQSVFQDRRKIMSISAGWRYQASTGSSLNGTLEWLGMAYTSADEAKQYVERLNRRASA